MLRPALVISSGLLFLSPAFAATSPPDTAADDAPCYEAETPILLGTFLEPSGSAAAPVTDPRIGVSPPPITILVDPPRLEPPPRVEPIKTNEPGK